MPRNPKLFISGTLIELTFRTEEGLPFSPNELIDTLLINVLARAQTKYPIRIVSYVVMRNHIHLLVVVIDPKDVPTFVCYCKRELAHYINRLMGRRQKTVWAEGYDSPIVLDSETAIRRLKYIYLNPVSAKLIRKGQNWPLSSAFFANQGRAEIRVKRIPRNKIPKLPHRDMTLAEIKKVCAKLQYAGTETYLLKLEPDAWMSCFEETKRRDILELRDILHKEIKREEKALVGRKVGDFPPIDEIKTANIRTNYSPTKFGKRMLCYAKNKLTRIAYISWYRNACRELPRFLREKKKDLIYQAHYPPGFFAPGGFLSASLVPFTTPVSELA
jgi:REP element-mobilizing transposase RayT